MAVIVDIKVLDDAIDDGELKVKEFAFVGFNITHIPINALDISEGNNGVEFYFYLSDFIDNTYLFKTCFIFNENTDTDLAFLNNSIHDTINLNKLSKNNPEGLSKLLIDIAEDRQYFCTFNAVSGTSESDLKCIATHNKDGKQHKLAIQMSYTNYFRINIIKNQMIYNIPLNIFIDQDTAFDKLVLHNNCEVKYLGCDTSYSTQVLAFYSLCNIGLINPIKSLNRIVASNILEKEKFITLYKSTSIINMTKIFFVDWVDGKKRICIYFRNNDSVDVYMLSDDIKECSLMRPYDMVYGKDK